MQKWKYKKISRGNTARGSMKWFDNDVMDNGKDAVVNRLDALGDEGWELIAVIRLGDTSYASDVTEYYLKQPI